MNFLAHAYLSFGIPEILVGNMIADLVKGKQIEQYPESIRQGIHIHRQIDSYTDSHPVTQQTMKVFRGSAGKYAGPFLDVSYDHFLALDTLNEPSQGWKAFAEDSYSHIEKYSEILPPKFCSMFMYMKSEDWLYSYRYKWMIERSFERLRSRANYLADDAPVFDDFMRHYKEIESGYKVFFPQLKEYVQGLLKSI